LAEHNDKGKLLEEIVASLHNDKNLKIEKNIRIKKREIDVLISVQIAGYHKLKIPIECKNQSKKVGSSQINSFSGKLNEIGLSIQNAIFVSINGYTRGAKESGKKAGIKLLTVHGLSEDRLSKEIHNAIQSVIYVLPVFNSYEVTSSIPNVSNNEHLLFFDKNKKYQGSIADIIFNMWKSNKIPLSLGTFNFTIEVPDDWFNLYENELHLCFPIKVELLFVAYVISYYGKANNLSLIDDETQKIEKNSINLDFNNYEKCTVQSLNSENELNNLLNNRNELYKLDVKRIKLPKVRLNNLFYPLSKKVYQEFQSFYSHSNRTELEIAEFTNKIKEIEKDIFSIWDD